MKLINPIHNMIVLQPAVAAEKVPESMRKKESDLLYNKASAQNQQHRFTTFKIVDATRESLIGLLALVDDGVFFEFTQANKNLKFAYERDAIAFIDFTDDDNIDIVHVTGKGTFDFDSQIENLTQSQKEFARKISHKTVGDVNLKLIN